MGVGRARGARMDGGGRAGGGVPGTWGGRRSGGGVGPGWTAVARSVGRGWTRPGGRRAGGGLPGAWGWAAVGTLN
jgi:hypothetical protein